jgi:predicted transcriptional regulator
MDNNDKKRWFNIRLDEDLYQFLKQYAETERIPMSTIIRQYILKLKREASESQTGSPLKSQEEA